MATIHVEQNKRPWIWAVPLVVVGLGVLTWAVWPDSQEPGAQVAAVGTPGSNGQPMGATGTAADTAGAKFSNKTTPATATAPAIAAALRRPGNANTNGAASQGSSASQRRLMLLWACEGRSRLG